MEWLSDVSAGRWIAEETSGEFGGTVPNLLPRGFEAYVRVFHPFSRFLADPQLWEDVSWAATAADFGTAMQPLADALIASPEAEALQIGRSADLRW